MKPYIIVPTAAALIILTAFSYYLYGADIKSLFLDNGKTIEGKADNGVFEKTSFLNIPQTVQLHRSMENNPIAMKPGLQEMPKQYSFTVVSGASSGFFSPGLKNLVGSVHHWSPGRNIVIWDLGLSEEQVAEIKTWCRVTYKKFHFEHYAPHFRNLHTYAWKPAIIKDMVDDIGNILWIDAGSYFSGNMSYIDELMTKDGYILIQGQDGDVTVFLHEKMCQYMNVNKTALKRKPSFAGGFSGWSKRPNVFHKLLLPWLNCALEEPCIAPAGSSLSNHRFDQSALSLIAYSSGMDVTAHTELRYIEKESRNGDKSNIQYVKKKPC